MERKLFLALLLSLLPLYLLFTRPALAGTTINVNFTVDVINPGDGKCTLREAIIAANTDTVSGVTAGECLAGSGADTIIVPAGMYTLTLAGIEDSALTGDLDITQSVTINGAGVSTIIKQQGTFDRIFEILSPAQVTISAMQIQGGLDNGFGGGGIKNRSILTLNNALLIANYSSAFGGGLANTLGASATLNSVSFGNNSAGTGGGIGNDGTITLTNVSLNFGGAGGVGGGLNNSGTAILNNVTISYETSNADGGGIYNLGVLTVSNTVLNNNQALGDGGGIYNVGVVSLTNVTLSANTAVTTNVSVGRGGGIYSTAAAALTNVTLASNSANNGGGIYRSGLAGSFLLENTIVANSSGGNCGGSAITSLGHNLDSVNTCGFSVTGDITNTDPLLGPLASNGGATETHALLPGSPAINAGTDTGCPATDQRGLARISPCDIGAFEYVVRLFLPIILK